MDEKIQVGKYLKRFRQEFNVTQTQVSDKIGIIQQTYYKYESEKVAPTVGVIVKMALAFDVSADYLLGLIDAPRPLKGTESDNEFIEAAIVFNKALQDILKKRGLKGGETQ